MSKVLLTPVDGMVEIIKNSDNLDITTLAKKLALPREIIERWLTILEEYKIITVHYKGFEGFIKLTEVKPQEKTDLDIEKLKDEFIEKCKKKNLSFFEMKTIWPQFLEEYKKEIKFLFEKKAKDIGFETPKIELAWEKYLQSLEDF